MISSAKVVEATKAEARARDAKTFMLALWVGVGGLVTSCCLW